MSDEIKPATPAQELVQWQEDYNARVEAERRVEADRALKGRERVNKALASEDATLEMMRRQSPRIQPRGWSCLRALSTTWTSCVGWSLPRLSVTS